MTRDRIALLLAVLATLAVAGTTAVAVATYPRRHQNDLASAPAPRDLVVRGEHAVFEVPGRGWTATSSDTVVYYVDRGGHPSVGVAGPAVFHAGYCRGRPASNRGFAGFTRPVPGRGLLRVEARLMRAWLTAVSLDRDRRTSGPHTPVRTREVTLADGSPGLRSTSVVTVPRPGRCDAPRVAVTLVGFHAGAAVVTLVLVRDVGAPGTLGDRQAERVLASLRQR
jgi:hypothetical protein